MLMHRDDLLGNPAADFVRPVAMRALDKPLKAGLRAAIEQATDRSSIEQHTIEVNLERLDWIASKTAVGLYLHLYGLNIDDSIHVGSHLASEMDFESVPDLKALHALLMTQEPRLRFANVYCVRVVQDSEDPRLTLWWHTFYETVAFISAIVPMEILKRNGQ